MCRPTLSLVFTLFGAPDGPNGSALAAPDLLNCNSAVPIVLTLEKGEVLLIPADEFGPGVRLLQEPVAVLQNL